MFSLLRVTWANTRRHDGPGLPPVGAPPPPFVPAPTAGNSPPAPPPPPAPPAPQAAGAAPKAPADTPIAPNTVKFGPPPAPAGPATMKALGQLPEGSQAIAFKSPANGNRDVAVIVPPGTDLGKPVEVLYLFHGNGGSIARSLNDPGHGGPLNDDLAKFPPKRNVVFVLIDGPNNARGGRQPGAGTWMRRPESFADLEKDVEGRLRGGELGPPVAVGSRTVAAHSGGGSAVAQAAAAGGLAQVARVDMCDASYGDWAGTTARNAPATTRVNVYYLPGTQTADGTRGLQGPNVHLEEVRNPHPLKGQAPHNAMPRHCLRLLDP